MAPGSSPGACPGAAAVEAQSRQALVPMGGGGWRWPSFTRRPAVKAKRTAGSSATAGGSGTVCVRSPSELILLVALPAFFYQPPILPSQEIYYRTWYWDPYSILIANRTTLYVLVLCAQSAELHAIEICSTGVLVLRKRTGLSLTTGVVSSSQRTSRPAPKNVYEVWLRRARSMPCSMLLHA